MSSLDPMEVMDSLNANLNNHDIANAMDLFSDDSVVRLEPSPPPPDRQVYQGEAEIRDWLHGLMRENLHVKGSNFHIQGNEVSWQAELSADRYRRMGSEPARVSGHAVLWGALIKDMTLTFSPETAQKMQAAAGQKQP